LTQLAHPLPLPLLAQVIDENSDDDTDDSKNFGRGHDEDEEDSVAERVEVRSVDFSGIDAGDEDEDIVGRH
jgi:hypothetical protein